MNWKNIVDANLSLAANVLKNSGEGNEKRTICAAQQEAFFGGRILGESKAQENHKLGRIHCILNCKRQKNDDVVHIAYALLAFHCRDKNATGNSI